MGARQSLFSPSMDKEDVSILTKFLQEIKAQDAKHLEETLNRRSPAPSHDPSLYIYEEEAIEKIMGIVHEGTAKGIVGGLAVFTALRFSPRVIPRFIHFFRKSQHSTSQPSSENFRFGLDVVASLFAGKTISDYTTDYQAIVEKVGD